MKAAGEHEQRLILDYAYLCFLLGNDFVPNLPSLQIRSNGIGYVVVAYKQATSAQRKFLVEDGGCTVNRAVLTSILGLLAAQEQSCLIRLEADRQRSIKWTTQRINGINDDPVKQDQERYHYVENQYRDTIRAGTDSRWRERYYEQLLDIPAIEGKKTCARRVEQVCYRYLRMTLWILQYYQGLHDNWTVTYPFPAAPSVTDLHRHVMEDMDLNAHFEDTAPASPLVQLMCILPSESAALLPPRLAWYTTHKDSPIHYMYPIDVNYQYYGRRYLHEARAFMPPMDRELLDALVVENLLRLSEADQKRNTLGRSIKLKN